MSERQGDLAATPCEYGCADGFLYDPRVQGNIVECPNCKGDGSCKCEPWAQRWKAETPERCANCGGLFDPRTVDARRVRPGEVLRDAKPFAAREPLPEACACESCQDAAWPQAKGHDAATTPRSRGRCPVCGYSVALRKDGTMLAHLLYGIGFGGRPVHCNGGGRDPLAPNEKHVWETPDAR